MPFAFADDRPPRVLFCTDTYPPQVNGVSVVTALSVSGLRQRGWQCAVVAPRYPVRLSDPFRSLELGSGASDEHVTLPSVCFPPYPDLRLAAPLLHRVAAAVRQFRPDLVHCETEFVVGRLGQIAARAAGLPAVSSYHTDFARYTDAYGLPWLRGSVNAYIRRFHRRSLRVYTPSEPARADLRRLGVTDVEVWGRGVDTELFQPAKRSTALRAALGLEQKFTFVHVGRLAAEKNVHVLLSAFALARELLPSGTVHLVIAGSGPAEAALRAEAPDSVSFLGNLDRQRRLPELYASGDAFLFASVTETLGLVVLEAMASGLPVIAAPAGGVADHLGHEAIGLAYPAGDAELMAHAMVRLVRDRVLRDALARGARRTAEGHSWNAELDRLDVSYRQVCEAATSRRSITPMRFRAARRLS